MDIINMTSSGENVHFRGKMCAVEKQKILYRKGRSWSLQSQMEKFELME